MLKILLFAAGGYGLLVAGVYLMQGRMLYLSEVPGRELTATPAAAGMAYEDVFLQTGDLETETAFCCSSTVTQETSRTVSIPFGNSAGWGCRFSLSTTGGTDRAAAGPPRAACTWTPRRHGIT